MSALGTLPTTSRESGTRASIAPHRRAAPGVIFGEALNDPKVTKPFLSSGATSAIAVSAIGR